MLKFERITLDHIEVFDYSNESSDVIDFFELRKYLLPLLHEVFKVDKVIERLTQYQAVCVENGSGFVVREKTKPIDLFKLTHEDDDSNNYIGMKKLVDSKYDEFAKEDY